MLQDKRILVGVTGSIAAFKVCTLVRLLREEGAEVRVVMTANAERFIGSAALRPISGGKVFTDAWELPDAGSGEPHIDLSAWADLAVVYPASQSFVGRYASCRGEDLLSLTLLSFNKPVLLAPAMHHRMIDHPLFLDACNRLRAAGIHVLPTNFGRLASGEQGAGRLIEPEECLSWIRARLTPKDLGGVSVLVSAGATREHVDAVRFLSNPSSGRMGIAVAAAAAERGARVSLVLGPGNLEPPPRLEEVVRVTSAEEMAHHVKRIYPQCEVLVMAAAVADFRPNERASGKIPKGDGVPVIELERTEDILMATADMPGGSKGNKLRVGFAMGTGGGEVVAKQAADKLERKKLDLIVANAVDERGAGFGVSTNKVTVVDAEGSEQWPLMSKDEVARRLIDRIVDLRSGPEEPE